MAHVGKECGFRAVCDLGPVASFFKLAFIAHGFGDIDAQGHDIPVAGAAINKANMLVVPQADHALFDLCIVPSCQHFLPPVGACFGADIDNAFVGHVLKNSGVGDAGLDFVQTVENRQIGIVGHDHPAVRVKNSKPVAYSLHRIPQAPFSHLHLFAGLVQIGFNAGVFIADCRNLGPGFVDLV